MKCRHRKTRCVHGDEVWDRMSMFGTIRRQVCLDCGKTLDRGLPQTCTVTGGMH